MISNHHLLTNKFKKASLAFVCASSCFLQYNLCAMQNQPQSTQQEKKSNITVVKNSIAPQKTSPKNGHTDIKICFLNNQNKEITKEITMAKNKLNKILTNKMQLDTFYDFFKMPMGTSYAFLYNRYHPFKVNGEFNKKLYTLIEEIIFKPSETKTSKFFEWYKIAHRIIKNNPHMVKKIENYFVSILMNFVYLTPNDDIQTRWNQLPDNKIKKIILFFENIKNHSNTTLEQNIFHNFIVLCEKINSFDASMQNNTTLNLSAIPNSCEQDVNIALFLTPYILTKKKISDIQRIDLSYNDFSKIPKGIKYLPNVTTVRMIDSHYLYSLNNLRHLQLNTIETGGSNYLSLFHKLRPSNKTVINGLATSFLGEITERIGKTPMWINLGRAGLLAFGLITLLTLIIKNGARLTTTTEIQFLFAYGSIITLCAFGILVMEEGEILFSNIQKSIEQTKEEFKHRNDPAPPENELLAND